TVQCIQYAIRPLSLTRAVLRGDHVLLLAPPIATEPTLAVRCLGRLHVAADGRPLGSPVNRRARSVLKYLVLHRGRSTPRDGLMDLLWPDSPPPGARNNLDRGGHRFRPFLRGAG